MKKCGGSFKKKLLKGNKGRKERKKNTFCIVKPELKMINGRKMSLKSDENRLGERSRIFQSKA